jgi:acyl carrier protein
MKTYDYIFEFLRKHYVPKNKGSQLLAETLLLEHKVIDSIGMLELMLFIEKTFGIEVSEEDITSQNFGTINRIVAYIDNKIQFNK